MIEVYYIKLMPLGPPFLLAQSRWGHLNVQTDGDMFAPLPYGETGKALD